MVYGFNGAALELIRWAKARGLRCILEQTMAPHRWHDRILREEAERWPGWQPGLDLPAEGTRPLAQREEEEWELADLILCGSEFVVRTMAECGGPIGKCRVVPYGVDLERFATVERQPRTGGKLRVLFAGEVGLRRGRPTFSKRCGRWGRSESRPASPARLRSIPQSWSRTDRLRRS